ncbi:MAG: 2-amino-4-hydroxy-6-hydroxymethyldihydropteridine diphosphokinase [Proteobacteria bacterium]|nr:2-amino-4-hydroxy-6-hydroxymethyldihydropteridine diphosphokinase [Pseudomonadota bacterium]MBT4108298.1 2-amino-4-hydroxy-6-hydroxymethyldihydropteridine diphosphokinase [Pseudomonadota bacterium]MBT5190045.1 2-amino-4-hydroxy-6-hydroxymethyldihydropteridine diphosphokinase [Pseudomonadota bacterium]MBT6065776.1 2-amino-4-hydroxy-6-hydroxymethyldihydropteridine diphosphokinase [Pseudomonadota bacterium]MBT6656801.1 2-amino-4-hydroxy-6-hydroxymethyldihydropteridine diphosphokinase [Pseudomon
MTSDKGSVNAWIGLGANLGDPQKAIQSALRLLVSKSGTSVTAVSSFYRTAPVGFDDQPDFLNGVARVKTSLGSGVLLERLLEIEAEIGRIRTSERFGPRVIDLDLLLFGDQIIDSDVLSVPHPRMQLRRFVLEPLAEIEGEMVFPGGVTLSACLRDCDNQEVAREGIIDFPEAN